MGCVGAGVKVSLSTFNCPCGWVSTDKTPPDSDLMWAVQTGRGGSGGGGGGGEGSKKRNYEGSREPTQCVHSCCRCILIRPHNLSRGFSVQSQRRKFTQGSAYSFKKCSFRHEAKLKIQFRSVKLKEISDRKMRWCCWLCSFLGFFGEIVKEKRGLQTRFKKLLSSFTVWLLSGLHLLLAAVCCDWRNSPLTPAASRFKSHCWHPCAHTAGCTHEQDTASLTGCFCGLISLWGQQL